MHDGLAGHVQKAVDRGKEVNVPAAVNKDTITRGLRYSVATGNWGQQGTAGMRAGVSQVSPESATVCFLLCFCCSS